MLDTPIYNGPSARTTLEHRHQVHTLLDQGVDLLACPPRLRLTLNAVKGYARADT